jgi:hypothetical protein
MTENTPLESLGATPERMRREGGVILEDRSVNEKTGQVLRVGHKAKYPTVFHYYEKLKHLTEGQRDAGCRMAVMYFVAGRVPNPKIPWVQEFVSNGSVASGYNPSDSRMDAEDRLRKIEKELMPQEAYFIRQACLYNDSVGGNGQLDTMRRIRVLSNGLRIAEHLLRGVR